MLKPQKLYSGGVTLLVVGADVDLHPVQALDFLTGIFLIDLTHDDMATSRGVDLTPDDRRLLKQLIQVAGHQDLVDEYRELEQPGASRPQP